MPLEYSLTTGPAGAHPAVPDQSDEAQPGARAGEVEAAPGIVLPDGMACANCNARLGGDWCGACGQKVLRQRHTVWGTLAGVVGRVLNLERGLLHTAWRLTVAPGEVVRGYLAGRTVAYTHPAAYLLLCFAAFALSSELFSGAVTGGGSDRFFVALVVPCIAMASWALFRGQRWHFAEHFIAVMYLVSQAALLMAVLQIPAALFDGTALMVLGLTAVGTGMVYFVWSWSSIFPARPVLSALGGLLSLVAGSAGWLVALAALLQFLRN